MAAPAVGLESLPGLVLESIIHKVGGAGAAALACTSTRLRAALGEELIWRRFCSDYFALDDAVDPDGATCACFKEAYKIWFESFKMYPFVLVRRVKNLWASIKHWLQKNFPEVLPTLNKGASEAQIRTFEQKVGFQLPMPTKLLFRFCNGQQTMKNVLNLPQEFKLAVLGIMGGYEFYHYVVNVHLLPLKMIARRTLKFCNKFEINQKIIVVAESCFASKMFFLNCENGQLYVGTKNLDQDGEMMSCVPRSLIRLTGESDSQQDGLLLWLEEHLRRLHSGMLRTRLLSGVKTLSLFPETLPSCTMAITNGVKVRSSAIFVPEASNLKGGDDKYYYYYSFRMSLLPDGCMVDNVYHRTCQLHSRHLTFKSGENIVNQVHGEAVIGKYPILSPGMEEFVYESCTPLQDAPGSMSGSFTFFPGSISRPEGRPFEVVVAPFVLEEPSYIF